jgi:hypothetical protein
MNNNHFWIYEGFGIDDVDDDLSEDLAVVCIGGEPSPQVAEFVQKSLRQQPVTEEELDRILAPHRAHVQLVRELLGQHGIILNQYQSIRKDEIDKTKEVLVAAGWKKKIHTARPMNMIRY